jgi:hypothetical protein
MVESSDDVIKVATGTQIEMNLLADALKETGITSRVVGDDLTAGLGTIMPGTVELWVISADAQRAADIIRAAQDHHKKHGTNAPHKFPHPESDPNPDQSQGPHHSPEPYRPSP